MILKEQRHKQDFDILVFLDTLVDKTKKIMNGRYGEENNPDKQHDYFGKKDYWMREHIGILLFQISEDITAANGIKVIVGNDYILRRGFQQSALANLNKLRDAVKLAAFYISRISSATIIEWTQTKVDLAKALQGWIDSDYKRYNSLL